MELYTLRYVLAVADSGNFSLAAQACHVGQPALSQQIAKLEKELGVALFARNPRGATLTEAGKDFVLRAREILQRAQALQAEMSFYAGLRKGSLNLGIITSLQCINFGGMLSAFCGSYPDISVNIVQEGTHRLLELLLVHGFETVQPSYQFIKALLNHEQGLHIDNEHFMIISPDEGSMSRAIYLANILGVDMGMYYKRLDYSKNVGGRHPIAAYEFLGPNVAGKDMILIDDMISSGDTILKIASLLKDRGAGRIYLCSTFGLFTDNLKKFDEAHAAGVFDKLLTTNMVYQSEELLAKPYYISCDMSKYIALIIDTLNHDMSVSHLLNPVDRIKRCVNKYMAQYEK